MPRAISREFQLQPARASCLRACILINYSVLSTRIFDSSEHTSIGLSILPFALVRHALTCYVVMRLSSGVRTRYAGLCRFDLIRVDLPYSCSCWVSESPSCYPLQIGLDINIEVSGLHVSTGDICLSVVSTFAPRRAALKAFTNPYGTLPARGFLFFGIQMLTITERVP